MNFLIFIKNIQFVASFCAVSVIAFAAPVSAQTCCDVGGDDEDNIATTATIPLAGDMFGSSLAMDGDTAVIGSPFNDDEIDNGGRAYVFTFDDPNPVWAQQQELVPSDPGNNDQFGFSVAIDGNVIVVGAPFDDITVELVELNAGSAYIYEFSAGSWSQVAKITAADDAQAQDFFGYSVAISGNWIAVGARGEDSGAANGGAVYLFERPAGGWDGTIGAPQKITASDPQSETAFGFSVAIDGAVLIVGNPFADISSENSAGQASIFRDDGNDWLVEDILTATVPDEDDFFGHSVSISGDGVLVGAPYEDSAVAIKIGAAYVFRYNSVTQEWDDEVRLTACDEAGNQEYGISVSLDGIHAAIGAREIQFPQDAGSAYIYRNLSSGWVDIIKYSAYEDDTDIQDALGTTISLSGDKVLVGAPFWDFIGSNAEGAMYNFEGIQCPWDLNNDGEVATADLLSLLAQWGTDPGGPPDFNDDGDVSTSDLLALLANWGPCVCGGTEPLTLEEELEEACLSEDDWDDYYDVMTDPLSPQSKKDRYQCWMEHYINDCNKCFCIGQSGCPNPDPFN